MAGVRLISREAECTRRLLSRGAIAPAPRLRASPFQPTSVHAIAAQRLVLFRRKPRRCNKKRRPRRAST